MIIMLDIYVCDYVCMYVCMYVFFVIRARKMGVEIIFEQLLEVLDVLSSLKYIDLSPITSSAISIIYCMIGTHINWTSTF